MFLNVSALGCALASNFDLMLVSYSLSGLALAMVTSMTFALIGEHFPLEKRANAVGWIVAGGSLSYVIGAPVISFIAGLGGWRFAFFVFVLPISLVSLLLAFIGVPSASLSHQPTVIKGTYLGGFKEVLSNKSANACLAGNILRMASFVAMLYYAMSFFRQRFLVSTDFASIIMLWSALCYTFGSLVTGRFVNRLGSKPLTALTTLLAGVFTISFVYLPNLWLSLALTSLGAWFFGMSASASSTLTLEQSPRFRGTMMSINSAALNMGSAVGAAIGGLVLVLFDYEALGLTLGALGVVAAIVFHLLTVDPTRT
jgi:predicted MFS family arabinose efflux permease